MSCEIQPACTPKLINPIYSWSANQMSLLIFTNKDKCLCQLIYPKKCVKNGVKLFPILIRKRVKYFNILFIWDHLIENICEILWKSFWHISKYWISYQCFGGKLTDHSQYLKRAGQYGQSFWQIKILIFSSSGKLTDQYF